MASTTPSFQTNLMNIQSNLLNFAYMLTSNRDDAYDLLQDTTLKALDNQDKYAEGTNFKGWVFTIMRNLFINNYRRGVRHRNSSRHYRQPLPPQPQPGLRYRITRRQLRRRRNHCRNQ